MHLLFAFTAWLTFGQAFPAPDDFSAAAQPVTQSDSLNAAAADLKPLLSKNAEIVLPSGADWAELQIRGTSPRISPKYNVVIEVATEEDVAKTLQIANRYNIPFLAVSGTHGWTKTLNNLSYGIQINMRKLNTTTVDKSGTTATVEGGTLQYEITRSLYAKNKQAGKKSFCRSLKTRCLRFVSVTGLCECVSVVGPLMGGGHSMLQARHGFALDNIVSARVVLANGTAVTASKTQNADLFWAVRGAGHNFGVVTSMVLNIYDIQKNWTVYSLIFTQDKIEKLFALVNDVDSRPSRPSNMFLTGVGVRIAAIDANNVSYTPTASGLIH
jgi:FAD/FMN-containing dehydrogenase